MRGNRRGRLKAAAVTGALQIAPAFVVKALAAEPVRIGLDNPLTGIYAAVGKNELIGCQLAVEQINAKGGILGRTVEPIVEDSTSGDQGIAVLLEEQNVHAAGAIADRACVLDNGRLAYEGAAAEFARDEKRLRALAGASAETWASVE